MHFVQNPKTYLLLGLLLLCGCKHRSMATAGEAIKPQHQHPAAYGEIIITPLPEAEAREFMNKIERADLYADDAPLDI